LSPSDQAEKQTKEFKDKWNEAGNYKNEAKEL